MNKFEYVRKSGDLGTLEAADSSAALSALRSMSDVDPSSGVQIVKNPTPSATTPAANTATTPTTTAAPATPITTPTSTTTPTASEKPSGTPASPFTRISSPTIPTGYEAAKALTEVKSPEQLKADEDRLRAEKIAAAQESIKRVNAQYDIERAQQKELNVGNLARTNALSALMGFTGSTPAESRAGRTEQIGKEALDLIEARRATALSAIYGKIDENVQKMQEAALESNRENAKSLLNQVSQNALNTVQSLAATVANNVATWDDFKKADPEAAKKLVEQSGQSEYYIRELWKSKIPEQFKPIEHVSYADDGKGGTVMRKVSFNPVTKKVDSQEYNIAAPLSVFNKEGKPIEVNGMLLVKQADGTYKNVAPAGPIDYSKTFGTGAIGEYNFYAAQEKEAGRTPLTFDAYQNRDANRKARIAASANAAGLTAAMTNTALKISDDYEAQSKNFFAARDGYNKVLASAKDPSAAGDLSLIFAYMKTLDPTSVVREGEFATAQNAGSVPERVVAQYNKVISGERLSQSQREDFVNRAKRLFDAQKKQQDSVNEEYKTRATKYGVPADLVVRDTKATGDDGLHAKAGQTVEVAGKKYKVAEDGDTLLPL